MKVTNYQSHHLQHQMLTSVHVLGLQLSGYLLVSVYKMIWVHVGNYTLLGCYSLFFFFYLVQV